VDFVDIDPVTLNMSVEKLAEKLQLAKSCDIEVVAEGVENIEQMNMLRELKCNIAQGYLISKPKSADEFLKLVKEQA
jgi:EAL domain-containing protein (putative c-di-GMP-specific phosphodiesterase class I)